jgi:dTDP-glucose pyrophosphorylase
LTNQYFAKLDLLLVQMTDSVHRVLSAINSTGDGIALVVDDEKRLLDTITDGDIRRALLEKLGSISLESKISDLFSSKNKKVKKPLTLPVSSSREKIIKVMKQHSIRHLPLVDADNRVVDLALLKHFVDEPMDELDAVVMAGGFGTRLQPLTTHTPKPMLPVGGKPLLEHIIDQLKSSGIENINISTFYHGDKIQNHFGDGESSGVNIGYLTEENPLGTAGALKQLDGKAENPMLVMNGDILTNVDFKAMHKWHQENSAILTVAVYKYELQVPYGVVECRGGYINRLVEKPKQSFFINAGIYLLSPEALEYIPAGRFFNMTDLIEVLRIEGEKVAAFPIHEYWLDIGKHDDYQKAQDDVNSGKLKKAG